MARSDRSAPDSSILESLDDAPILVPTENTLLRRSLEHWFSSVGVRPRIVAEFEDSALLKAFGSEGAGINAFVNEINNFSKVIDMYQVETGNKIADSRTGITPSELGDYLHATTWERQTPLGGEWDVERDDSGITRPDLISMSHYKDGGQVFVQSQNEYLLGEMEIMVSQQLEKGFPEKNSFAWVSNTYNICK